MKRNLNLSLLTALLCAAAPALAAEQQLTSPDGKIAVVVSDVGGLHYRVVLDGKPLVRDSRLGLEFQDGTKLGPDATIGNTVTDRQHNGTWVNRFGTRRVVPDRWREMALSLRQPGATERTFGLIVRAYDDGVAFRYDLPKESGLGDFVLTKEDTEFRFGGDYRCWYGEQSVCAENHYPESTLSRIPTVTGDRRRADQPFQSVLPLLVETPNGYVAVAESDLRDWAGMFIAGTGTNGVDVALAPRSDGKGLVVSSAPRVSPWRVLMIGRRPADLMVSNLITLLATPNRLGNVDWVKPGVAAWDSWWTGVNPTVPQFTGLAARGDTRSHEEYIDFAAEMGWPYKIIDWMWYQGDPTKPLPLVDMPAVFAHAKEKNVKLFVWLHSADLQRAGVNRVFAQMAGWGAAGAKIDFMNSDSQETVQWYESTLQTAAKYHLMVDFHGAYKPTGLARTYPNFITQEGVLGNEYNKLPGNQCTPLHTVTLPFTRGLLGPMDFTPGGFLNRRPEEFAISSPAQVMGTRSRQMAMTVLYLSPLLVLCDSPANYRGQPGVEFFRDLPTVWDDSVVLDDTVGKTVAIARRSGRRWYVAAMNGDAAANLTVPLQFLGKGRWTLHSFADRPESTNYQDVVESRTPVTAATSLPIALLPAGGYAAVLSQD